MEALARKLYKGANTEIANMIVGKMDAVEIIARLGDLDKLPSELKTQLIIAFPKTKPHINLSLLDADQRTILLCIKPTVTNMKKFDWNADDMKVRQYRYILNIGGNKLVQHMYKNITDEKLALFGVNEWEGLLSYCRNAADRFDIKTIRNQSHLRQLILNNPHILYYTTIEDMKNCTINASTWIRIITKMDVKDRRHVPAGFKAWAGRDIFKQKLTGRKFKNFTPDWANGLYDGNEKVYYRRTRDYYFDGSYVGC